MEELQTVPDIQESAAALLKKELDKDLGIPSQGASGPIAVNDLSGMVKRKKAQPVAPQPTENGESTHTNGTHVPEKRKVAVEAVDDDDVRKKARVEI